MSATTKVGQVEQLRTQIAQRKAPPLSAPAMRPRIAVPKVSTNKPGPTVPRGQTRANYDPTSAPPQQMSDVPDASR